MTISQAKKAMNDAMRTFKDYPSAHSFRILEQAMRDYQDAVWCGSK